MTEPNSSSQSQPDENTSDTEAQDILQPDMSLNVQHFEFTASDGINLRGEMFGDRLSKALPVLCLPGLTRNAKDFHPLAERLASDPDNPRLVMILNSRGRGTSDYDSNPANYDILTEANDALHALSAAGLEEAIFIGTSRGGLLTMAIAALRPGVIAGAVLNDIGPVINAQGLARIKTYLNNAKPVSSWSDAIDYMKAANFGMFPALSDEDWHRFAHMTFKNEKGRPARDFDIAIAKALESVDLSQPLPNAWPQFIAMSHAPVLVLRGELSDILTKETTREMVKQHPDCQVIEVKGQGHAPVFLIDELNDQVADILCKMDEKHRQLG
ncbi:MAG: alpha/beta hydrolase [Cohaesibacter sp.]|jgi:pimeloyl-ACP methyl ester carboxylesterase|nr:alpha/beta hydrolase [Cohaesibacter sp.]